MDVTQFVSERIDDREAEALARDASAPIHTVGCFYYNNSIDPRVWTPEHCDCDPEVKAMALADVAAMRKIVERQRRYQRDAVEHRGDLALAGATLGLLGAVVDLARIWSDHPDFNPKW